jgi:hypothetical protein
MSAPDYLWPARPEYLRRRSTVVLTGGPFDGHIGTVEEVSARAAYVRWDDSGRLGFGAGVLGAMVGIDLRDLTARAHAAMAWTSTLTHADIGPVPELRARRREPGGDAALRALCRMRAMDESVTVDEAREALGWAERVAGVAP